MAEVKFIRVRNAGHTTWVNVLHIQRIVLRDGTYVIYSVQDERQTVTDEDDKTMLAEYLGLE
jgi:hypothetical protein